MKLSVLSNASTGAGIAAPTLATDGVPLMRGVENQLVGEGFVEHVDEVEVLVEGAVTGGTAGTIASIRLYGWDPNAFSANKWFPIGGGPAGDTGKLNANATVPFQFAETGTDIIRHAERVRGLREFTRIYAQYGVLTNVTRLDVTLSSRGVRS